ncbi:MAG: penicillin-binding transpeptidase domain-containing protein [Spongiibacteraceae bacterium]|jgi:cell division protein FtsI (penicillin-binding protein 3)|nr:penicillin-binding transpeptidase domain-containing protein [Spongiibacteraceae bacterium]
MSKSAGVKLPLWRLRVMMLLLLVLLCVLCWRLLGLQVMDTERGYQFLQGQGDARTVRTEIIPAHRGQITDRNGEPLAISTPVISLWANPQEAAAGRELWPQLARELDMPLQQLRERLGQPGRRFVYLQRHLPPARAEQILDLKLPGIYGQREYRRFYPAGEVTAHLLGFTNIDDRGQEGLELAYDEWLSGKPGSKRVLKDRTGKIIREIDAGKPAEPGRDLVLSIDLRLQYMAYRELRQQLQEVGAAAGSLVMLDSRTGEVLAMANVPSFNPNNRSGLKASHMRNRAMIDLMEPGSTTKPIAFVAALESGKFTPDTEIDTRPGWMQVGRKTLKDPINYGVMTLTSVITKSSQIGTTRVALALPEQAIVDVYRRFGLGQGSGTGFPGEAYGLLPTRSRWSDIERANFAFGYGLQVSPLQLARAYSVFANNGKMVPVTLLRRDEVAEGEQVISPAIAKAVVDMLATVVAPGGTGRRAAIPAYTAAGKTGTVHKVGEAGYDTDRYRSVFAGFAPVSSPRVVTVVVIDDPTGKRYHGGEVAAPVFGRVVGGAMRLLNVAPDAAAHIAQEQRARARGAAS